MTFDARESSIWEGEPAECVRIQHGVDAWRLTSADQPIQLSDGLYVPEAINVGGIERSEEWTSGQVSLTIDYLHPVARLYHDSQPREPVVVTVFSLHRDEAEVPVRFSGEVAKAASNDRTTELRCLPSWFRLRKRIPGLIYSSRCPLALYGERCGVDRTAYRERIGVAGVSGVALTAPAFGAQPDGWWTNGYVQTLQGETRFIINHAGTTIVLEYPLIVAAGQQLDAYPGCDRSEATCQDKFANLDNHMGFSRIPIRELFGKSI